MIAAKDPRHDTSSRATVQSLVPNGQTLNIEWADGHNSTFHTVWLRDNCSCDECGDHSGGSRFFELCMMSDNLALASADADDGMVRLVWESDGHETIYDGSWLRSHCYSATERTTRRHQPVLWDASITGKVPEADYSQAISDEAERLKIHDAVRTYGICLLRNVPAEVEETEKLAGLLGYVRETHYGRIFEIVSTPNPTIIANAPVPLRPHTDENFREPPPGIMIFHTIRASEDGGGASVMTDGFMLAEELKRVDPDAYELLSKVPIPHRRFIEDVGLRAESPIIQHDYFGRINQFRLNERTMGPLDLPHELMEPAYAALRKIFDISYDPRFHLHHLLDSGEALVFDNARVLHARTGFNGNRHVRLTHIGSDEFYSRWRQLRRRLNGDINLI
ncbi:MAG: TauD/TfdA family dioxygenase [Chloroflexota bacterium]